MEIQRAASSFSIIFLFAVLVTSCGGNGGDSRPPPDSKVSTCVLNTSKIGSCKI
jgi:hypothetical protein